MWNEAGDQSRIGLNIQKGAGEHRVRFQRQTAYTETEVGHNIQEGSLNVFKEHVLAYL